MVPILTMKLLDSTSEHEAVQLAITSSGIGSNDDRACTRFCHFSKSIDFEVGGMPQLNLKNGFLSTSGMLPFVPGSSLNRTETKDDRYLTVYRKVQYEDWPAIYWARS